MKKNIWEKEAYYDVIEVSQAGNKAEEDKFFLKFKKIIKNYDKKQILDVGCGEGWMIQQLIDSSSKNHEFYGIDVSRVGIERAKKRKLPNTFFNTYDGTTFPFDNEKFDLVISSFVFEHLSEPMKTFLEMSRVVKKDGIIAIACPNFGSPLFTSPCNKRKRLLLMFKRFIKEFRTKSLFKNNFHWDRVEPIILPEGVHIPDFDTLSEPNLSSFEKFISANSDKYTLIEYDSLWNSYQYENKSIKKILVNFARFLGLKNILRFSFFGSFFYAVVRKN